MKVLHLTYDYPDSINPNKTVAMKNLIDISRETFNDTYYISLNRTTKKEVKFTKNNGVELSTFGLPMGILFRYTLKHSINRISSLNIDFSQFDLVHAHKLTFEGPIAYKLFSKYKIPYILSIQQTDIKILRVRVDLRSYYRKILKDAKKIVIFSPWIRNQLKFYIGEAVFNSIDKKIECIPLVVNESIRFKEANNDKFVTVFNLNKRNIKIKNIQRTLLAFKDLKCKGNNFLLDIIGEGSGKSYIYKLIYKYGLEDNVKLIGKINNESIIEVLSEYKAFILCSFPETFGMVYIEALNAGIPIIYSKNAGVDGYFDEDDVGIKVNHKSINEISNALYSIDMKIKYYKKQNYDLQQKNKLKIFDYKEVAKKYLDILKSIV